ncbi:MAG TPA: hypothetical protein VL484_00940 [Vicinamibacterales bacterium]|nr:hypothetical protein [Vicinamibacterales bacterium]
MEQPVHFRRLTLGLIGALALLPASAYAQISKINTLTTLSTFIRGVDVAHDDSGGALIVSGVDYIYAQCVGSNGAPAGNVLMKPAQGHPFGSFPRARFNPNNQNYLVVWPEEQTSGMLLKARTISCPSGAVGSTVTVAGAQPYGERGVAIDFSASSNRYLIAYETILHVTQVQLLDANGNALISPMKVSAGQGESPGATWNSVRNEFGVSFSDNDGASSALAIVPATNPGGFHRTAFNPLSGAKAFMTDVAYNTATQHYLMGWYQDVAGTRYAKVAEFDGTGALIGFGTAANFGSYDALALAYNRNSGTTAIVGIDGSDELRVAELNAHGVRFASDQMLSTGFNPVRYPRVDASASASHWFVVLSRGSGSPNFSQFQGTGEVLLQTGTGGGGPAGSYTGGGGTTTSSGGSTGSTGCTTVQPGPGWTCVNGGWLPPTTGTTSGGTTGGCTTVQPGPGWTCVNGGWLPPTTGTTSGGTTGGCTTVQPGTGWTCVNGNWLPPGSTTTTTGTCTTVKPGTGWTCVNGNWLPPGSTTTTSSCTTVQPGTGWTCVNGNWLPPGSTTPTSSCTTVQPGTGWTCVNGNWLPPGSTTTTTSSCTTVKPGPDWTCVNGNWLPPGMASASPSPLTPDGVPSGPRPVRGWLSKRDHRLPPDSSFFRATNG